MMTILFWVFVGPLILYLGVVAVLVVIKKLFRQ